MRSVPALALAALAAASVSVSCSDGPKPFSKAALRGREVFLKHSDPKCGTCHTLKDAGTTANVGPNLDVMRPSREKILRSVQQGVGVMPTQKEVLKAGEMEDVASYVFEAAGRTP